MRGRSRHYQELREHCESLPIIDCHDHSSSVGVKWVDPIEMLEGMYLTSDLQSAALGAEGEFRTDTSRSLEERWPVVDKAWRRCCHTGYAQVAGRVLKKFYGIDELTLDALKSLEGRMLDMSDQDACDAMLARANIALRLVNIWPLTKCVLDGTLKLPPRSRLVVPLPEFHRPRNYEAVQQQVGAVGRKVTSLDEYLAACREIFEAYKRLGAVAFKDQSAYTRKINYTNPTRREAEELFHWMMEDPRRSAGYPDGFAPLSDFLFHEFLRMARDLQMPVQLHTGIQAWNWNDVRNANAVQLTPIFELHRDVRFDLFHANWPYGGELLFLAKNYPNVTMDFCWANMIDPVACQRLLKQALSCVPHGKIHGYGSDISSMPERSWAHAEIGRDNIAIALSDMIDLDYIDLDDAKQIARMWLFDNPNEFFSLGLQA